MVKKVLRVAATFLLLSAGYVGYVRGFAILKSWVAPISNVPLLPASDTPSRGSREATELAESAFGAGHWSTRASFRYYFVEKGYWLYWDNHEKIGDGKRWKFWPVAVVLRDGKSCALKSIVGDRATLDFNRPFDGPSAPGAEAARVIHALITGNVKVRDDNGTPGDLADDMTSDPMSRLEFDEGREEITSLDEEQRVVFRQKGMTASGVGMRMILRPREAPDPATAPATSAAPGFSGVKTIFLLRDVEVDVVDVGHSGIVPGAAKSGKVVKDKDGKVVPPAPRPGHIQCASEMQIDLPKPREKVRCGPPAPPDPTFATFSRNVVVRQGDPKLPDQLNCDHLWTRLLPTQRPPRPAAEEGKPEAATAGRTVFEMAMESAEEEEPAGGGDAMSNLSLHQAIATGHAVWLQSPTEGMTGRGNELHYDKYLPDKPYDVIYFRGDTATKVEKTEFAAAKKEGEEKGKPQLVHVIHTKDVTIFQYAAGGPRPSVVARGPGTLETREVGKTEIERFASWQDKLEMFDEPKTERRVVRLYDHPRVSSPTQGDITARDLIIAYLRPKPKPAEAEAQAKKPDDPFEVASIDGKKPDEAKPADGDGMAIERVVALNDVHLVTVATPADPKAKPPKKAVARRDVYARKNFQANFPEPPAPDPKAKTDAGVAQPPPAKVEPVEPGPDGKPADAPAVAEAEGEPKAEEKPKPEPADPALSATADDVWALVRRQPGENGKSEVEEAKLTGDALVHQDSTEADATKGGDVTGDFIHLNNRDGEGKALIHAIGSTRRPARVVTPDRTIVGPIFDLDQGRDHAWVTGPGLMVLEQGETGILDDSAKRTKPEAPKAEDRGEAKDAAPKDKDRDKEKAKDKPKKKKPPMTIAWGRGPGDKAAKMDFFGQPRDARGNVGPAKAKFRSHVTGQSDRSDPNREDDSRFEAEELDVTFDGPIPLVRPKAEPGDKAEKEPQRQVAFLEWRKGVIIETWKYDPEAHYVVSKKKIVGPKVTYDKPTGDFEVFGKGSVDLYNRDASDAAKPGVADAGKPKPKAKPRDKSKPLPDLKLTHVDFRKGMKGRMAAEKGAAADDYSVSNFREAEAVNGVVANDEAKINPEAVPAPADYYRIYAPFLQVISEPPPKKGDPERTLLRTAGGSAAYTPTKTIEGDVITYDSLSELTYVYGNGRDVHIVDQNSPGQPFTSTRGSSVRHDHIKNETKIIDPKEFELIDPNSGVRATPFSPKPSQFGPFTGYVKPPKAPKIKDPNDLMNNAGKLKLPPRSDKERRGFYGH